MLEQYGDRLVCVRYRYDAQRKTRFKTVELIVAQRDWNPPAPRFADDALVSVRVGLAEVGLLPGLGLELDAAALKKAAL